MNKKAMVPLHNGIIFTYKKKEILPFVTVLMDLGIIMLIEISRSEEDRYYVISLICGI